MHVAANSAARMSPASPTAAGRPQSEGSPGGGWKVGWGPPAFPVYHTPPHSREASRRRRLRPGQAACLAEWRSMSPGIPDQQLDDRQSVLLSGFHLVWQARKQTQLSLRQICAYTMGSTKGQHPPHLSTELAEPWRKEVSPGAGLCGCRCALRPVLCYLVSTIVSSGHGVESSNRCKIEEPIVRPPASRKPATKLADRASRCLVTPQCADTDEWVKWLVSRRRVTAGLGGPCS